MYKYIYSFKNGLNAARYSASRIEKNDIEFYKEFDSYFKASEVKNNIDEKLPVIIMQEI